MNATAIELKDNKITLDGYDGAELVVKRIVVWRDYEDRTKGACCVVRHGHPGILLDRKEDACKIQVDWMGQTYIGWVTFWFVKELKTEWQLIRLNLVIPKAAMRHRPI